MESYECFRGRRKWIRQVTFKGNLLEKVGDVSLFVSHEDQVDPFPYELPHIFGHCIVTSKAIRVTFPKEENPFCPRHATELTKVLIDPLGPLRRGISAQLPEEEIGGSSPLSTDGYDSDA